MKHFVANRRPAFVAGSAAPLETVESRAKDRRSTTKSLQANHWLPLLATVVVGRKMLPFQLIKSSPPPRFSFVVMTLEIFLEASDRTRINNAI